MIDHSAILPVLVPFVTAILLLLLSGRSIRLQRSIGLIAAITLLVASAHLICLTDTQPPLTYALGNWAAPFGITLVADRVAALGVMVTAILALAAILYACGDFDQRGRHFHAIFQLQLVGINGAFLTGDVFNLFVFFEVMLLASYILLAHGGGLQKSRAGFAYVTLNLAGSAVFLIALGLIYGTLGTLNLADIALQLQQVEAENTALVRLAGALLITVFVLKAAVLPLSFWLPHAYAAAGAPVAALFAIMTKVGIVAVLRVQMIAFVPADATAGLVGDWLIWAALATIVFSVLGVLTSKTLQSLVAWLVLGSAGVLLLAPPLADPLVSAAALYYLTQSAIVGAAFFMLAGLIASRRPHATDQLIAAGSLPVSIKIGFLVLAATAAGLPPFSGFLGKLMLLSAVSSSAWSPAIWTIILVSGLLTTIALAMGGSHLFWEIATEQPQPMPGKPAAVESIATFGLIGISILLLVFAKPVAEFTERAATQLHAPQHYIEAVIPDPAAIARGARP